MQEQRIACRDNISKTKDGSYFAGLSFAHIKTSLMRNNVRAFRSPSVERIEMIINRAESIHL